MALANRRRPAAHSRAARQADCRRWRRAIHSSTASAISLPRHVARDEIFSLPAPSAFSLAGARLGWSQQDCALLSLHGRAFERLTPHLQPRARIIALSWDETTPARIAEHLAARGMGASRMFVLEHLGGPQERLRETRADALRLDDVAALNTVAIELDAAPGARIIPLAPGLPRRVVRERRPAHQARNSRRDALRARAAQGRNFFGTSAPVPAPSRSNGCSAIRPIAPIAIERDASACGAYRAQCSSLGVPDLEIVTGAAPQALASLAPPDAIFIGGGANAHTLDAAWRALSSRWENCHQRRHAGNTGAACASLLGERGRACSSAGFARAACRPLSCARSGHGRAAMARGEAMTRYAAGIGARRGVAADVIVDLVRGVTQKHARRSFARDAVHARKQGRRAGRA